MNKDKQPQSQTDEQKLARRKIIKGIAAGVPAVMTLSSGAASAANSFQRCALGEGNPLDPESPDYDLNTALDGTPGSDLSCEDIVTPPLQSPGESSLNAPDYYDSGPGTALRERVDFAPEGDTDGDKACIVFAKDDGFGGIDAHVSYGADANSAPVTASCYVSFTVKPKP